MLMSAIGVMMTAAMSGANITIAAIGTSGVGGHPILRRPFSQDVIMTLGVGGSAIRCLGITAFRSAWLAGA
jgi:hypothetical protein